MFGKKKKEEKHQNAFVKILGAGCKNCEMLKLTLGRPWPNPVLLTKSNM